MTRDLGLILGVALCAGMAACERGPSEEARAAELAEAYRGDSARLDSMRAHTGELADSIAGLTRVFPDARKLAGRLQPVIDAAFASTAAGAAHRYADIPGIAAAQIETADLLGREVLDHGIALLDSASKLLEKSDPDFAAVNRLQAGQELLLAVSKTAIGFRDFLLEEVSRLARSGPREVRPVAFDTLAALHVRMQQGREFRGLDSLLRVTYQGERVRANRTRMAATMERVRVAREAPQAAKP